MRTVKVELSEQEVRNLLTFLDRVPAKGIHECAALFALANKLDTSFEVNNIKAEEE